jgi:hypothetical protein
MTPKLVDAQNAAEILGTTPGNLAQWRIHRRYDLPWVKVGSRVMYDLADLVAFIESRKIRPTEPQLETVL